MEAPVCYAKFGRRQRGPGNSKIVDEQYLETAAFPRVYQESQSFQIFLGDHTARILKINMLRGLRHPFIFSTITVCHISLQLFCGLCIILMDRKGPHPLTWTRIKPRSNGIGVYHFCVSQELVSRTK